MWAPTSSRTLLAIALALGATACQARQLSEGDVAAIRSLADSYERAVLAGDHDAAAALWADDLVRMPPNAPAIRGRAAMLAELEARAYVVGEFELTFEDIDGRDGLAYGRGPYSITITMPGNPEPVSDRGKTLAILRKQEDGTWVFAIASWNSDLPLTPPPSEETDTP